MTSDSSNKCQFEYRFDGINFEDWQNRIKWGLMKKNLSAMIVESDKEKEYCKAEEKVRLSSDNFKEFCKNFASQMPKLSCIFLTD